jgi:hypothetical protein
MNSVEVTTSAAATLAAPKKLIALQSAVGEIDDANHIDDGSRNNGNGDISDSLKCLSPTEITNTLC